MSSTQTSKIRRQDDSQLELFLGQLLAPASKDDRASMEHPFFSLQKGGDKAIRMYSDERTGLTIKVRPGVGLGSATIWDKDVLLYLSSLIRAKMDAGVEVPRTFRFTAQDMLVSVDRGTGGKDYKELELALLRLKTTTIETNIPTGGQIEQRAFSFLDNFLLQKRPDGRMDAIEITVADWFYRAIQHKEVLTIDPGYFALSSGLDRRLYELARKHCGRQPTWSIALARLHQKTGSQAELKKFRFQLRRGISSGEGFMRIVDYLLTLDDEDMVRVYADTPEGRAVYAAFLKQQGAVVSQLTAQ